jgi:hypothetical protein
MTRVRALSACAAATAVAVPLLAAPAYAVHGTVEVTGLTRSGRLVTFAGDAPGTLLSETTATGLAAGEKLVAIDVRPATGVLYGVATDGAAARLYRLAGGAATAVGAPFAAGGDLSMDFNPVVDRVRLVSSDGTNLRLHPDTGAVVAVDGTLTYGTGAAEVADVAYTNSDTDPATGTTLYDVDSARDALAVQDPPNAGTLAPVGPLGVATAPGATGFDIHTYVADGTTRNLAFVSTVDRGRATLGMVNLATGAVTSFGEIGGRPVVVDIAVRG